MYRENAARTSCAANRECYFRHAAHLECLADQLRSQAQLVCVAPSCDGGACSVATPKSSLLPLAFGLGEAGQRQEWRPVRDSWEVQQVSGEVARYRLLGRGSVEARDGYLLRRHDEAQDVFFSDDGPGGRGVWSRAGAAGAWQSLGAAGPPASAVGNPRSTSTAAVPGQPSGAYPPMVAPPMSSQRPAASGAYPPLVTSPDTPRRPAASDAHPATGTSLATPRASGGDSPPPLLPPPKPPSAPTETVSPAPAKPPADKDGAKP